MAVGEVGVGKGKKCHGGIVAGGPWRHEPGHERMNDNLGMDRVVSRQPRHLQQAADLAFWLSRPMAERMAAVELLRQQAINPMGTADVEPRLQRICRVAQRQGR